MTDGNARRDRSHPRGIATLCSAPADIMEAAGCSKASRPTSAEVGAPYVSAWPALRRAIREGSDDGLKRWTVSPD
jgi:hypothetical protein